MIKSKPVQHRVKARRDEPIRGISGATDGVRASRGGTTYREEYQTDHGPDLDEPLDGAESEHEF